MNNDQNRFFPPQHDKFEFEKNLNVDLSDSCGSVFAIFSGGSIFMLMLLIALLAMCSCTDNSRARTFGGSATVELPKGTKYVGATWKDQDLWYSFRPSRPGELPETITLQERSNFGLLEGKVIFKEQ